jgi:hypothetical protein
MLELWHRGLQVDRRHGDNMTITKDSGDRAAAKKPRETY